MRLLGGGAAFSLTNEPSPRAGPAKHAMPPTEWPFATLDELFMDQFARLVVGYHGCSAELARDLLLGTMPIGDRR